MDYCPAPITMVVATRAESAQAFFAETATGRSLGPENTLYPGVGLRVFIKNRQGLPALYNRVIEEALRAGQDDHVLVFVHDDVHLFDYHWPMRVMDGLNTFDVIGIAGNTRRAPAHVGWMFDTVTFERAPKEVQSGYVAHTSGFPIQHIDRFGPPRQAVQLLDGVFLAVRVSTLRAHPLRFDPRFTFDFYDLDFSREANHLGLTCGTYDIAIGHESTGEGGFGSQAWWVAYQAYIDKWQDPIAHGSGDTKQES